MWRIPKTQDNLNIKKNTMETMFSKSTVWLRIAIMDEMKLVTNYM